MRHACAMLAAVNAQDGIIRDLLDAGADINARDNKGKTALMFATVNGYQLVVQTLVDSGADVNSLDKEGNTALIMAAKL